MGTKAKQAIAINMLVEGALHKDVAENPSNDICLVKRA